ncbi:Hypothetical protein CAP_3520 [Chondromyces apiculatus DSM 436]|uniref:Uncharacterized protein n=1 Tax=Chondromyces apiculatus DSM 436 TaxID=1192034 RepID=A0A017T8L9_9BACT|nr:Hypothetical protein CAP_3520 [Chondromyces apiculatus DSM 436]
MRRRLQAGRRRRGGARGGAARGCDRRAGCRSTAVAGPGVLPAPRDERRRSSEPHRSDEHHRSGEIPHAPRHATRSPPPGATPASSTAARTAPSPTRRTVLP